MHRQFRSAYTAQSANCETGNLYFSALGTAVSINRLDLTASELGCERMLRDHQRGGLARPRQTKRYYAVADGGAGLGMTAGGDKDILLTLPQIGHRIGNAGDRQPALP